MSFVYSNIKDVNPTLFSTMWTESKTDIEANYPFQTYEASKRDTEEKRKELYSARITSDLTWQVTEGRALRSYYGAGIRKGELFITTIAHAKDEGSLGFIFSDKYNEALIAHIKSLGFNKVGILFMAGSSAFSRYLSYFQGSRLYPKVVSGISPSHARNPDERVITLSLN